MTIFKKALYSKIDVFAKFESAINLEIEAKLKKKLDSFYLGHMYAFSSKSGSEPFRALGDLTWNDPISLIIPTSFPLHFASSRLSHGSCMYM